MTQIKEWKEFDELFQKILSVRDPIYGAENKSWREKLKSSLSQNFLPKSQVLEDLESEKRKIKYVRRIGINSHLSGANALDVEWNSCLERLKEKWGLNEK